MFLAVLLAVAPNYPLYSYGRKDKEVRNSHQMECDLVMRMNSLGLHVIAWVNLTSILLKKEVRRKGRLYESEVQKQVARAMLGAIRVEPIHGGKEGGLEEAGKAFPGVSNTLLLDQVMGQSVKVF